MCYMVSKNRKTKEKGNHENSSSIPTVNALRDGYVHRFETTKRVNGGRGKSEDEFEKPLRGDVASCEHVHET